MYILYIYIYIVWFFHSFPWSVNFQRERFPKPSEKPPFSILLPSFTALNPDPSRYVAMGQKKISKLTLGQAKIGTWKTERNPSPPEYLSWIQYVNMQMIIPYIRVHIIVWLYMYNICRFLVQPLVFLAEVASFTLTLANSMSVLCWTLYRAVSQVR